jgi:hypothetical protein
MKIPAQEEYGMSFAVKKRHGMITTTGIGVTYLWI